MMGTPTKNRQDWREWPDEKPNRFGFHPANPVRPVDLLLAVLFLVLPVVAILSSPERQNSI
jgi:hypothetical protein